MRPTRFGDYDDLLKWLSRQTDDASKEISRRAHGKAQLSGHIRQNFFGLRQFFLVNPGNMSLLSKQEADTYTLSKDAKTAATLSAFVKKRAQDEGQFKLSTWTRSEKGRGGKECVRTG